MRSTPSDSSITEEQKNPDETRPELFTVRINANYLCLACNDLTKFTPGNVEQSSPNNDALIAWMNDHQVNETVAHVVALFLEEKKFLSSAFLASDKTILKRQHLDKWHTRTITDERHKRVLANISSQNLIWLAVLQQQQELIGFIRYGAEEILTKMVATVITRCHEYYCQDAKNTFIFWNTVSQQNSWEELESALSPGGTLEIAISQTLTAESIKNFFKVELTTTAIAISTIEPHFILPLSVKTAYEKADTWCTTITSAVLAGVANIFIGVIEALRRTKEISTDPRLKQLQWYTTAKFQTGRMPLRLTICRSQNKLDNVTLLNIFRHKVKALEGILRTLLNTCYQQTKEEVIRLNVNWHQHLRIDNQPWQEWFKLTKLFVSANATERIISSPFIATTVSPTKKTAVSSSSSARLPIPALISSDLPFSTTTSSITSIVNNAAQTDEMLIKVIQQRDYEKHTKNKRKNTASDLKSAEQPPLPNNSSTTTANQNLVSPTSQQKKNQTKQPKKKQKQKIRFFSSSTPNQNVVVSSTPCAPTTITSTQLQTNLLPATALNTSTDLKIEAFSPAPLTWQFEKEITLFNSAPALTILPPWTGSSGNIDEPFNAAVELEEKQSSQNNTINQLSVQTETFNAASNANNPANQVPDNPSKKLFKVTMEGKHLCLYCTDSKKVVEMERYRPIWFDWLNQPQMNEMIEHITNQFAKKDALEPGIKLKTVVVGWWTAKGAHSIQLFIWCTINNQSTPFINCLKKDYKKTLTDMMTTVITRCYEISCWKSNDNIDVFWKACQQQDSQQALTQALDKDGALSLTTLQAQINQQRPSIPLMIQSSEQKREGQQEIKDFFQINIAANNIIVSTTERYVSTTSINRLDQDRAQADAWLTKMTLYRVHYIFLEVIQNLDKTEASKHPHFNTLRWSTGTSWLQPRAGRGRGWRLEIYRRDKSKLSSENQIMITRPNKRRKKTQKESNILTLITMFPPDQLALLKTTLDKILHACYQQTKTLKTRISLYDTLTIDQQPWKEWLKSTGLKLSAASQQTVVDSSMPNQTFSASTSSSQLSSDQTQNLVSHAEHENSALFNDITDSQMLTNSNFEIVPNSSFNDFSIDAPFSPPFCLTNDAQSNTGQSYLNSPRLNLHTFFSTSSSQVTNSSSSQSGTLNMEHVPFYMLPSTTVPPDAIPDGYYTIQPTNLPLDNTLTSNTPAQISSSGYSIFPDIANQNTPASNIYPSLSLSPHNLFSEYENTTSSHTISLANSDTQNQGNDQQNNNNTQDTLMIQDEENQTSQHPPSQLNVPHQQFP